MWENWLALWAGRCSARGHQAPHQQGRQKAYTHVTAAGLRMKDAAMETVTTLQENAADILASAKDINQDRAKKEAEEAAAAQVENEEE